MSIRRSIVSLAAPAALLLLLSACATSFHANVARFQQMPPPQGQSFIVQAADPRLQGGLEFQQYAHMVTDRLAALGYRPVEGAGATLVVTLDYGVDHGHEKVVTTPGVYGPGYGGWGYGGWGRPYGGRFAYGWGDPFWYAPFGGPEVNSFTYYVSSLDVKISRTADGRAVFEGRARARSLDDSLPHLVPNLIEAMFAGFPGRSGEEIQITVPPPPKPGQAPAPITAKPVAPDSPKPINQ